MPSSVEFNQLVSFLLDPQSYPHPVGVMTTIETHSAIVFLTGTYAYKLKKPVNFGFLDFSTLEQRRHYTQLELTLNQRTAPNIYQSVLPIFLEADQETSKLTLTPSKNTDTPIEYLLKMVQFDPNAVLGRYLTQYQLSTHQQESLVQHIAQLHQQAEVVLPETPFGSPKSVLMPMEENFPPLLAHFTDPETQYRLRQLKAWTVFQCKALSPLIQSRKRDGHIKACHGDLHLDNIALIDGTPTLFDGIEFNEYFRWIDPLNDFAFLLADLTERGHRSLKNWLKNRYFQLTGDYHAIELLDFYQTYRHLVRAKVSAIRAQQIFDQTERLTFEQKAIDAILQAENSAYTPKNPKLIVMQGLSGSGKSTIAETLSEQTGAFVISSDIERKRIYGIDERHRVSEIEKSHLYSLKMSAKTYQTMAEMTEHLLRKGEKVIVDATFLKQAHRQPYQDLAQARNIPYQVISVQPTENRLLSQLAQRTQNNTSASDADISVMQNQKTDIEYPSAEEPHVIYHDTSSLASLQEWLLSPIT